MSENIPKDPVLLLSYVNLKLRDYYSDLNEMCKTLDIDSKALTQKLAAIDYTYDPATNQFI